MEPVQTKAEYYRRYIAGEFGNRLKVWRTWDQYQASGYTGLLGIRNTTANSPFCRYDIPHCEVPSVVAEFVAKGCNPGTMTFNEAAPDKALLLQGEVMESESGMYLFYSVVQAQMRIALLKSPRHAYGNSVIQILKTYLDPNSYEWVRHLLDVYPGHVVEFSAYDRFLGSVPLRNTLIWEVRNY